MGKEKMLRIIPLTSDAYKEKICEEFQAGNNQRTNIAEFSRDR
jgi:hypothetical protein